MAKSPDIHLPSELQWGREIEPSEIPVRNQPAEDQPRFNGAERLNPRK